MARAVAVAFVLMLFACHEEAPHSVATSRESEPASTETQADDIVSQRLTIPRTWRTTTSELPISYLEDLQVDPNWQLSRSQRDQLAQLIAAAHLASVREYKQDYLLAIDSRLWRLIVRNYRGTEGLVHDGGVYLGQLMKYLIGYDQGGS